MRKDEKRKTRPKSKREVVSASVLYDVTSSLRRGPRDCATPISGLVAVVVIGVILEGIAEWLPKERRETSFVTKLTRTGWLILVAALAVEYVAQRNKDADEAWITASLMSVQAESLSSSSKPRERFHPNDR